MNRRKLDLKSRYAPMQQLVSEFSRFWIGPTGLPQPTSATDTVEDKRLSGEASKTNPWADVVKRVYLAYAGVLNSSVEAAALDDKMKERVRHRAACLRALVAALPAMGPRLQPQG